MYLTYDEELDEDYCAMSANIDQDDFAKSSYDPQSSCSCFRMGDDYTITKKQGF
jgi:hypothetical protein